jgi:hypothetical protein
MFGRDDPREMPGWLFGGFGRGGVALAYDSAVRAEISKQNYSVQPRYWYIDAIMRCDECAETFVFSAAEQRQWYEEYRFYVESLPRHCPKCRSERRRTKLLRQEYDRDIAKALATNDRELKARLISVIDDLCESGEQLPGKVHDNRRLLSRQIGRDNPESTEVP